MGILYDRHETDDHTIIRFPRYLGAMFVVIATYMALTAFVRNVYIAIFVTLIVIFVLAKDMRPLRAELIKANKSGTLTRSGSRMSVRNPLTYYIAKREPKGQRPKKNKRPPKKRS